MIFWIVIILSGAFAVWAVYKGFYASWVTLFNSVISIYLAIFLRPVFSPFLPVAAEGPYTNALIVLLIFIASIAILEGLSYIFFTSQFDVPFPKILDYVGSGVLGFFNGLLLAYFICLLISITPIKEKSFFVALGFESDFQNKNIKYIEKFIGPLNSLVSSRSNLLSTDQAFKELIESSVIKPPDFRYTPEPNDVNVPPDVNEPNKSSGSLVHSRSRSIEPNTPPD